ncbi:hypothetical protein SKAU_G00398970 [Synaphobranchus kaupii]|uniref:Uncharacterized protein n=1 Tax=Synaphobranchus kaupii TaxID=118154 RepID=A0A9Q1IA69_SYNKA|nr:hypothetical protein SKAU_G00398970 [Synaphobranchus kaupii]
MKAIQSPLPPYSQPSSLYLLAPFFSKLNSGNRWRPFQRQVHGAAIRVSLGSHRGCAFPPGNKTSQLECIRRPESDAPTSPQLRPPAGAVSSREPDQPTARLPRASFRVFA